MSPFQLVVTYTWPTFMDVEIFSLDTVTSSASLPPAVVELAPSHTSHISLPPIDPLDSYYDFSSPGFMSNGKLSVFNLIRSGTSGRDRFYSLTVELPLEGGAVLEGTSHVADSIIKKIPGCKMLWFGELNQAIAWLSHDEDGNNYLHFIDFTNTYPIQRQSPEVINFRGGSAHGPGYGTVRIPNRTLQYERIESLAFDDARGRILLMLSNHRVAVLYLV